MRNILNLISKRIGTYWQQNLWTKFICLLVVFVTLWFVVMYCLAQWFIQSESSKPLRYGVSFVPAYAESLGVEPKETMDELIGIGVNHFRLVSYWNQMEQTPGQYDFSQLDWQFKKAEDAGAKVTLSLGLKQPRWPECHMPTWAKDQGGEEWYPELYDFVTAVVDRYKSSPSLESYQLENEALLKGFGICQDFNRDRLAKELELVKKHDPSHPVIMSRSDNLPSLALGKPQPDIYGFSVYRRVFDSSLTKRYMEYPLPSWYYAGLAGAQKIATGKTSVIHELQAEAWPPNGQPIADTTLEEQNKSFNAERFEDYFEFSEATGMRTIDLWGGEYWYYRMVKLDDPSLWNVAKDQYKKYSL